MEISIDKDAIEKAVTDAIVQSAIGDKIKTAVTDLLKGYDNPIDKVLKSVITDRVMIIIDRDYREQIAESLKRLLTQEKLDLTVGKIVEKISNSRYDRD